MPRFADAHIGFPLELLSTAKASTTISTTIIPSTISALIIRLPGGVYRAKPFKDLVPLVFMRIIYTTSAAPICKRQAAYYGASVTKRNAQHNRTAQRLSIHLRFNQLFITNQLSVCSCFFDHGVCQRIFGTIA